MDYFLLTQDKRYNHAPVLEDWFSRFDKRKLYKGKAHEVPDQMLFKITPNPKTVFLDIIDYPYLLLSQSFKELVSLYEPNMTYKELILLDGKNKLTALYYLPILPKVDCLHSKSQVFPDVSVIKNATLNPGKINHQTFFNVGQINSHYPIVRLDLVESILRRKLTGIMIKKLPTERE